MILLLLSSIAYAQEAVWVEASSSCIAATISPEEAKAKALAEARIKAIQTATGIEVTQSEFFKKSEVSTSKDATEFEDVFLKLNISNLSGKIIEEEKPRYTERLVSGYPEYTVHLKAMVASDNGRTDKEFTTEIILPEEVFYDRGSSEKSDKVNFRLWASRDCYLYLFNIMSNDSVVLIFPNTYIQDNSYLTGRAEQKFEKEIRALGMSFPVALPEGKDKAVEGLFLVALKDRIDFTSPNIDNRSGLGVIPTYRSALTDIMKWLIRIPSDRRTQTFTGFEIRKKL